MQLLDQSKSLRFTSKIEPTSQSPYQQINFFGLEDISKHAQTAAIGWPLLGEEQLSATFLIIVYIFMLPIFYKPNQYLIEQVRYKNGLKAHVMFIAGIIN